MSPLDAMGYTLSKLARKTSTSPILERLSEMAWSSDRFCSKFCLLSYVTGISEREKKLGGQSAPLLLELSRTQGHPEKRASLRPAKRSGLKGCAGAASLSEIPALAVVYSPHAARVVYAVANAAAVGTAHDAVSERGVRAGNEPWPELELGQTLGNTLGVLLQTEVMEGSTRWSKKSAGSQDYQPLTTHCAARRAWCH